MHNHKKAVMLAALLPAAALLAFSVAADGEGWYEQDGRLRYRTEDGDAVGEYEIDGIPYLFAPNGFLQTGWQTIDGKRYYYDADGTPVFGWLDWRGERYYIDRDAGKLTAPSSLPFQTEDDYNYYERADFNEFGIAARGWFRKPDSSSLYYADESGRMASGETMIDGKPYLFDEYSHYLRTGLQTASDGITRYYDAETGEIKNGWISCYGYRYVYADAENGILKGEQTVNGKPYLFDEDGYLQTGFQTLSDGSTHYYRDEPDGIYTGWLELGWHDRVYYFDAEGNMLTGNHVQIGSKFYSFTAQSESETDEPEEDDDEYSRDSYPLLGTLKTGFIENDGETRYYTPYGETGSTYGAMLTGWQEIEWEKYHFSVEGVMAVGRHTIAGKLYDFDSDGKMITGWYTLDDEQYYHDPETGAVVYGKQDIGDDSYYFDTDGIMQKGGLYTAASGKKYFLADDGVMQFGVVMMDEKPYLFGDDGTMQFGFASCRDKPYYTNADGTITKGAFTKNGKKYIVGDDYALLTCWQVIDDKEYFFGWDGAMVTGTTEINGYTYKFNKSGVYLGADFGFTAEQDKLVKKAEKSLAEEPVRKVVIWDNGKQYCTTRTSFPTKAYSLVPEFELTDDDIKTIERFAAEHFAPSMTLTQKLWITLQWIHKQVTYAYDYPPEVYLTTYADTIFNHKLGQCLQYNGAMASVLAYFGFDVYMCKGCTKSGSQHFWTEVLIGGKRYYVETGNFGKNGKWQRFFLLLDN